MTNSTTLSSSVYTTQTLPTDMLQLLLTLALVLFVVGLFLVEKTLLERIILSLSSFRFSRLAPPAGARQSA